MSKRSSKTVGDPLETVVLIDKNLFELKIGKDIIQGIHKAFGNEEKDENMEKCEKGTVKTSVAELPVSHSVQWIIKKRDENGETIENSWKKVPFTLVFESSTDFDEKMNQTSDINNLLESLLGTNAEETIKRYRITMVIHQEDAKKKGKGESPEEKHIRLLKEAAKNDKRYQNIVDLETLKNIGVTKLEKSRGGVNEPSLEVNRKTKSILQCLVKPWPHPYRTTDGTVNWYPPSTKKSPTVAVKDNEVGLRVLWQKQLMQISRGIQSQHATKITKLPEFSSPQNMINAYSKLLDNKNKDGKCREGEKLLQSLTAGVKANIGESTSKQMFKMMTSIDGNDELK